MAVSFWLYLVFIFVLTLMYFDTEQGVDIRSGTEVRGHSKFSERNIFLMKIFEAILKFLHFLFIFTFSSFCFYLLTLYLCRFYYFFLSHCSSPSLSSSFHFLSYSSLSLSFFIILYLFLLWTPLHTYLPAFLILFPPLFIFLFFL